MKSIIIGLILVMAAFLVFTAGRVLLSGHHTTPRAVSTKLLHSSKPIKPSTSVQASSNPLSILPKPPFSCSTNVSLVQLSADYVVTNMGCAAPSAPSTAILDCNGVLFQHATQVNLDCYRPDYMSAADHVMCLGTTNAAALPASLSLNYSCDLSDTINTTPVYSCSGTISGYSSFAINLPMSVSCGA